VALVSIRDLAGIPAEVEIELSGDLRDYPPLPQDIATETALPRRPDYRVLLSEQRLREIGVDAARAGSRPTVDASLTYGYSAQSDDFRLEQDNNLLQLELSVQVPIYTGGAVKSQIEKARVESDRARVQIEKKKQEVAAEIDELVLRLREAYERILAAEGTLAAAEKALEITATSVDNGLATQLELKDAQVSYDSARLVYVSAIYEYLSVSFDWRQATGVEGRAGSIGDR
jgi:outer membrane protein TolC